MFLQGILPSLEATGLLERDWRPPSQWNPGSGREAAIASIKSALRSWECWRDDIVAGDCDTVIAGHVTRGLILLADHAGSAGVTFRRLPLRNHPNWRPGWPEPPSNYYPHQNQSAATVGHALLVAPTGSGKTEAALRWAARQMEQGDGHPPLFYVLPFKASMNAMRDRLVGMFAAKRKELSQADWENVALQHSTPFKCSTSN